MTQLKPSELAKRWRKSPGTLRNWRSGGRGPKYIKIGGEVRYLLQDILRYEKAHMSPETKPVRNCSRRN